MNDSEFNAKAIIEEENSLGERQNDSESAVFKDRFRRTASAFCPVCEKPVELLSFSRSAELFNTDVQDINFLAKRGELHRIHNRKGELMICSNSLFDCFDSRETRLLDSHFEMQIQSSFESNLGAQM